MFERVSTPTCMARHLIIRQWWRFLQHSKLFFLFKSTKISASKMVTVCSVYLLLAPIHKEIKVMSMSANIEEKWNGWRDIKRKRSFLTYGFLWPLWCNISTLGKNSLLRWSRTGLFLITKRNHKFSRHFLRHFFSLHTCKNWNMFFRAKLDAVYS